MTRILDTRGNLLYQIGYSSNHNLRGVDLTKYDLRGADLRSDALSGAYLAGVDLRGAILPNIAKVDKLFTKIHERMLCEYGSIHSIQEWIIEEAGEAGRVADELLSMQTATALIAVQSCAYFDMIVPTLLLPHETATAFVSMCAGYEKSLPLPVY